MARTSTLAVSLALCIPVLAGAQFATGFQSGTAPKVVIAPSRQSPNRNAPSFERILPSVVALVNHGNVSGYGALIGAGGFYIAQNLSLEGDEVLGSFSDGQTGHLHVVSKDPETGLVLLKSDVYPREAKVAEIADSQLSPGTPLLVVLQGGSVGARLESVDKLGIVNPGNRLLPLSEFQFETPSSSLGGAMVFTESGYLVGLVSATLVNSDATEKLSAPVAGGFGGGFKAMRVYPGPAAMTVGYALGLDVLHQVAEGFLSPTHEVSHASLGLFCRDGFNGALVTSVQEGSSADKAGLRASDVLLAIGKYRIRNEIDFAKVIFRQHVGEEVVLRIARKGQVLNLNATVGKAVD